MNQRVKRILAVMACMAIVAVGIAVYQNTTSTVTLTDDDINFFKKHMRHSKDDLHDLHKKSKYPCIHSKIVEEEKALGQPEQAFDEDLIGMEDISAQLPIEKDWKPIRIHVDYSNLNKFDNKIKTFIETLLIPPCIAYLEELLTVQRLTAPIKVDPYYSSKPCGKAGIKIPADHISKGVANSDIIFYVGAENSPNDSFLAYASYCPQQKPYGLASGRPTVAYFNMNLHYLAKDISSKDPMAVSDWIWTTLHEMIHSFVFSPNYWDMFLKEPKSIVKEGSQVFVKAPSIVNLARQHFGCPSATKVPLEDEGGQGTFGAHWERKSFGNEVMTGSQLYDSTLSKFTATMFDISGWYITKQQKTGLLVWGQGEGCKFLNNGCDYQSKEFCQGQTKGCSWDYSGTGYCKANDNLSSKCTYWAAYSNSHCNFPDDNMKKIWKDGGGAFGSTARCWSTDLPRKVGWQVDQACYESKCVYGASTVAQVKAFGNWYECKIGQKSVSVPGKGTMQCPDIVRFCFSVDSCPNSCSARGVCLSGKCYCHKGFKGDDCATRA